VRDASVHDFRTAVTKVNNVLRLSLVALRMIRPSAAQMKLIRGFLVDAVDPTWCGGACCVHMWNLPVPRSKRDARPCLCSSTPADPPPDPSHSPVPASNGARAGRALGIRSGAAQRSRHHIAYAHRIPLHLRRTSLERGRAHRRSLVRHLTLHVDGAPPPRVVLAARGRVPRVRGVVRHARRER